MIFFAVLFFSFLLCFRYNEYIGQTKRQFGTRLKEHQKAVFFCKKETSALSEHTCLTNRIIGWDNSKIITTNRRYHHRLCFLSEKRQLISDHIEGPLVAAFRSPMMKALDRSVQTLGL